MRLPPPPPPPYPLLTKQDSFAKATEPMVFHRHTAVGAFVLLAFAFALQLEQGLALRLHGRWRAARSWAFVDSFCFLPVQGGAAEQKGVLEYSVVMPRNSRTSLLFYFEGQSELDNAYYGDDLTCHEKYDIASLSGNAFPLYSYAEDSQNETKTAGASGQVGVTILDLPTQQERDVKAFSASIKSPVKKISAS